MSSENGVESLNGERPERACAFALVINTALTRCWGGYRNSTTQYHRTPRRELGCCGRETTERVS